jgi:predicted nucleic acid-binding protein
LAKTVVVADTSPLIGLARIEFLLLLPKLFETIYVPEAVVVEATKDSARPGAQAIRQALQNNLLTAHAVTSTLEQKEYIAGCPRWR